MPNLASLTGPVVRANHEILVVDDNPATRYSTVRVLKSVGFRTREAATGQEALDRADQSISAMVLDVHLPDIDGFEVCRRLRGQPPFARLPVLHLSAAYVTDEDKVRGLDSGADAYLTHPVEPAVLVATVQALVRARMAEAGMRASETRFRTLYAQSPGGICTLDAEGRFTDANPALVAMLKRGLDDLIGRPIASLADPSIAESVALEATRTDGDGGRHVFAMMAGDGERVHIEWRFSARLEAGDRIAIAADVSERVSLENARRELLSREQKARAEAERISRIKDDMIAVLSHELRTPLNAILGWTHLMQKRAETDEIRRGLAVIERNGKTQARLISDILDVSSLNMGKLRLALEWLDPGRLLEASLDTMRPALEQSGHTLQVEAAGPYVGVMADPARFQQIIWNLVSNAIKFSPPDRPIRISLGEDGGRLRLLVADQGQGIAPDFLPHLFDRFSQGDAARNRSHAGLGLGLSIVRQLVELHGGTIAAHSEGPGLGSRFEIVLPVSREPKAGENGTGARASTFLSAASTASGDSYALDGLQVLVIDDDEQACTVLRTILADRGAQITIATSYDQALALLETYKPDVLVSDVGMPGKDGYELLREIRRREGDGPRTPAIALTSFTRPQDEEESLAAGFDAHLGKPLRPVQLIRAVAELGARSQPRSDWPDSTHIPL